MLACEEEPGNGVQVIRVGGVELLEPFLEFNVDAGAYLCSLKCVYTTMR